MIYFQIDFNLKEIQLDILLAFLSGYKVLGSEENPNKLIVYTDSSEVLEEIKEGIEQNGWNNFADIHEVKEENWNKTWEENFDPVYIDDFCQILAEFHSSKPGFKHTILIQPKMAFGTGHHETTFMMIQMMSKFSFTGTKVFDFGCGTGILGIQAELLGASDIFGLDNDPIAISNAEENATLNLCKNTSWKCGLLDEMEADKFDFILANINRNVLLDASSKIENFLNDNGHLIISGILDSDAQLMISTYEENGFVLKSHIQKGEWLCMHFSL